MTTCLWPTGTAGSGPRTCDKAAKATALGTPYPGGPDIPVCGIHANSARRHGFDVASLAAAS
jgi:hypothetical protein